ncbi:carbohydrate porin [Hyphomicrobium sp.]|uniref:carbohydrate porin n=1 Tax=Hyphomicrobium sp. TaxID=82 RepID=UPI002C98B0EF|nr:carbohydrate porin [Hyphomicrobium sp.]HVZ05449.1 carbohydrate porin [Hyphomicrobium sp.]
MKSLLRAGAVSALALVSLGTIAGAQADDKPVTGIPDDSIAQGWDDPVRAAFARQGILYGVNWIGEYWNVAKGANSTGSNFDGRLEVYTDIDLEKLLGWKGGAIHANAYYIHGIGASTDRVGNIFAVSNIEGDETFRLFELWFEQSMLQDKLKVRVGSIAADSEFFISDTAAQFINGTFGWPGITAADQAAGGPGYPLASLGARVQYSPNDNLTILAAIFNGSPADPFADDPQKDNRHGVEFRLEDDPLIMIEGQFKYDVGLPGTLKLGGWRQFNHYAPQFLDPSILDTSSGVYGIIDQQIWKGEGDKAVTIFGRGSVSPDRQNLIDKYFDTGIVFAGFVPGRDKDTFGAAFGYGNISDDLRRAQIQDGVPVVSDYESVLELNYVAQIRPGFSIVPDFQYIWNPGGRVGSDEDDTKPIKDAAVFGMRTNISW